MAVDYSRYKVVKVEMKDRVALVSLNRPQALNAFNPDLHFELEDVMEDLAKDEKVNAAVLTGEGKAFSAGGDLKWLLARVKDPSTPEVPMSGGYRLINNILSLEKPLIAAVNGDAVGLGATVALFCDVIFAAENARFGDLHVKAGLVAGDGGAVIWPLLIGVARAKEYLMTGELISARDAEKMGLINHVVPPNELVPAALAFAQRLATGSLLAINGTKTSVNQFLRQQANLILKASLALEFGAMASADHAEAVTAFVEKRPPRFSGR